jgi:hypothetical protein
VERQLNFGEEYRHSDNSTMQTTCITIAEHSPNSPELQNTVTSVPVTSLDIPDKALVLLNKIVPRKL